MSKFCHNCGHPVDTSDTFCDNCGARLDDVPTPAEPEGVRPPPPVNPVIPPSANQTQTTEQSGAKTALAVILSAVSVLAVLGVVLFVAPGFLRTKNPPPIRDDGGNVSSTSDSAESGRSNSESSDKESSANSTDDAVSHDTETSSAETTAPATTTTAETTTAPVTETTVLVTSSAPAQSLEEKNAVYAEALEFSTDDRPDFSEFEWCFGQNGLVYSTPENAETITDPLGYTGGWKAMVIYNPTNSAGTFMRELDNIDIGVYDDTCIITIDWYYMEIDSSESYSEENMEDTNFFGTVSDTGLYASGDAEISINSLWKADGKEYALGAIITSDGLPAYLALVRP